jgi:hypothetical protein
LFQKLTVEIIGEKCRNMNNEEESTNEFEIEPVEIHPEMYSTNLFGEVSSSKEIETGSFSSSLPTSISTSAFNIFALTDAIGARKKRDAWVLYQKALASGMVAEEVFYKLVWQIKTMLIASRTQNPLEADMKPFPYNKAKGFLKNFSTKELENLSENLVLGYHRARRGEGEIETLVEKTLLKL